MCLIIQKPAGKTITMDVIKSAATRNSDGFGIMYEGRFDKWLDIKPDAMKQRIDALQDKEIGVHFRMATDGAINRKMAHPFKLADKSLLMHNGVLGAYRSEKGEKDSDTVKFIKTFVNPHIKKNGVLCPATVSDAAGSSAFLHMTRDGRMERFGGGWCEHYGMHFSNEYAWNAPYRSYYKADSYWKRHDDYSEWENASYGEEDIEDQNYLAGEQLRVILGDWTDQLSPGYSDVSYADQDALDQVYYGTLTMEKFVAQCDAQTLVKLFAILAQEYPLARHI